MLPMSKMQRVVLRIKQVMRSDINPLKLFEAVDRDHPIIVAVSGGSDSIALLLLASSWAKSVDATLQVVTIDHGLRPEAAAEAAFVSGVSEGLELPHLTLAWEGLKPDSGISQAARNARYELLEEFAFDIGAKTILVGHTANDQAETILMRNARGDEGQQGRGLSGIAPLMLLPKRTKLVRPLLDITRNDLRSYLRDMNQSWIEDPSNSDEAYERVRIRNALGDNEKKISELCQFASLSGKLRKSLSKQATQILLEHVEFFQGPLYSLPFNALEDTSSAVKKLVLQILIATAGGAEFFASDGAVARLLDEDFQDRVTMGHCIVEKTNNAFRFYREKRNLPSIVVGPGDHVLWDGRFYIKNNSASSYFCGPLSFDQLQALEEQRGQKFSVKPRAVLGGTPYLCGDGDDAVLPFIKGFEMPAKLSVELCVRSIEHFCPEYDFELLEFVDALKTRMGKLGHVG